MSDNRFYVMKFLGNPEKKYPLIMESICHDLAVFLELPILKKELVKINFSDEIMGLNMLSESIEKTSGYSFSLLYDQHAVVVNDYRLILNSYNKFDFFKIMIFDLLVRNVDRNKGNLLYNHKYKKIYMIDHTHCLIGPLFEDINIENKIGEEVKLDLLNSYSLDLYNSYKVIIYKDYPNEYLNEIIVFVEKIKQLTREKIIEIVKKTQMIWEISDHSVLSISEYIHDRVLKLDEILIVLGIDLLGKVNI